MAGHRSAARASYSGPGYSGHGAEGAAIDQGLTGDKIGACDPAAAPMHTDAEAAGAPTGREEAYAAAQTQIRYMQAAGRQTRFGAQPQDGDTENRHFGWILGGGTAVLLAVGLAMGLASFPPG